MELVLVGIVRTKHCQQTVSVHQDLVEIIAKVMTKRILFQADSFSVVTLCSPTSCNGGVCQSTQDGIICVCPTGKFGDRCQVIALYFSFTGHE